MISWWSKHDGVILEVLMCEIWIKVLLKTSALVGTLHIVNWNTRWNSDIPFEQIRFLGQEPLLLGLKAVLVTTASLTRRTSFVTLTLHGPTLACSHETQQSTEFSTSEGNVRLAFLPSQTASYFICSIHRSKFSECETWTKQRNNRDCCCGGEGTPRRHFVR
jgi:hypothetical protein